MMQGATMAGSQLLNNAQYRNNGQQTGFLGGPGAIDGTAQSFWNLGDPFNTTGHASSGHALSNILDPGNVLGFNQAANPNGPNGQSKSAAMFPNLGAASMIPKVPGGAFQVPNTSGGMFNAMAAQGAGRLFNPAAMPQQAPIPIAGGKPTQGMPVQVAGLGGIPRDVNLPRSMQ